MIRNEGIAMADEQNQGNTIINQGTTIDNLPGLDGMSPEQKQAFIDSAFVPIRGTISGEMSTRKVTGGDLAASGENKIDSIAVAGTTIEPVNKHVNIPLATTAAAGVMSSTDKSKLDNLVNIKSIGTMLDLNENGNLSVSFSGATGPLYVDVSDGTGGYDLAYDDTLTTTYHQGKEKPNRLSVAVPVPNNTTGEGAILCWQSGADSQSIGPHAVWCSPGNNDILVDTTNGDIKLAVPVPDPKGLPQANDGDVLTYDAQSDEIVWATQQTFDLPADPLPPAKASGGELIALTKEWVNTGTEENPNWVWSDLKWSYV